MHGLLWKCYGTLILLYFIFPPSVCGAVDNTLLTQNFLSLSDLSLEELGNIEITSVSKRPEKLSQAAASIFVITQDDIRHVGAKSLAEALRLAPNLQVAQTDSSQYAISARGFNNAIGNKLLVLIDGRTIYTPLFSGVFWEQQDVMLEDVDRIEVISGPGATLWGANAVNGVINIITRTSKDTQGTLVAFDVGNRGGDLALRYGSTLGAKGYFRTYAKGSQLQNTVTANGGAVRDSWERMQLGFRADWTETDNNFTLQGDAYSGESESRGFFGATAITPVKVSGMNLLARWNRKLVSGSNIQVQTYWDHTKRDDIFLFRPEADIFDVEVQHAIPYEDHKILWGGGYRYARDEVKPGFFFGFIPSSKELNWTNLFAQDEIKLSNNVEATLGLKLESNDYTGMEYLPSVRLAWKPSNNKLLWGAVSRAVRAPARLDREVVLPPTPPYIILGGPNFESEVAKVFEIGYRAQPLEVFNYSATAFYSIWDKLRSGQPAPAFIQNKIEGNTQGLELWGSWQATKQWRLNAGLTTLSSKLRIKSDSTDPVGPSALGNDPEYQWLLRSSLNIGTNQEFDTTVRHVGSLPNPQVPAYTAVDLRYAWRLRRDVEMSLTIQNLFDPAHPEFGTLPNRSEIERNIYIKLVWSL